MSSLTRAIFWRGSYLFFNFLRKDGVSQNLHILPHYIYTHWAFLSWDFLFSTTFDDIIVLSFFIHVILSLHLSFTFLLAVICMWKVPRERVTLVFSGLLIGTAVPGCSTPPNLSCIVASFL